MEIATEAWARAVVVSEEVEQRPRSLAKRRLAMV